MDPSARFELLHPPLDRPSGGNVYDRCLLDAAARCGFPLSSVVVDAAEDREIEARFREPGSAFRIWDGLLLERLAQRHALERGERAVLLHWLPSCDPALEADERARRESIERAIVDCAALIVVPGHAMQRTLRRRHPRHAIARCEPALREPFLALQRPKADHAPQQVELLTVSNLLPAKGLVELLPVLASLHALDWRWHLVGDRTVDPACARCFDETARRLGLAGRVVLHGVLGADEVVERMDSADLFVFPSRFESYGIALAEAAARALPVVAFRAGDAVWLFRNRIDSLLVAAGDHDGLREALREAIADSSLRARFRARLSLRRPARSADRAFAEFASILREASTEAFPSFDA